MQCYHCGSSRVHKHGKTSNGKQRFWCRACQRSLREQPQINGYDEQRKEEILRAYHERASLRGLSRVFGVSRNTVSSWLKKANALPPLEQTLLKAQEGDELELDAGARLGRVVIRQKAQKQTVAMVSFMVSFMSSHPANCGLRLRFARHQDLPPALAAHSRQLQKRPVLQRLLESLSRGAATRAT